MTTSPDSPHAGLSGSPFPRVHGGRKMDPALMIAVAVAE
jgi:hypothetical protein